MDASEVSGTLFKHLSFRSEKHKVIASNIANLNTPNYKAKELVFEDELNKISTKNDLKMFQTHHNHMNGSIDAPVQNKPHLQRVEGLVEQNDGNNVSLDKEVGDMAKNSVLITAISNAIQKDSRLFKSVIDSSAKN